MRPIHQGSREEGHTAKCEAECKTRSVRPPVIFPVLRIESAEVGAQSHQSCLLTSAPSPAASSVGTAVYPSIRRCSGALPASLRVVAGATLGEALATAAAGFDVDGVDSDVGLTLRATPPAPRRLRGRGGACNKTQTQTQQVAAPSGQRGARRSAVRAFARASLSARAGLGEVGEARPNRDLVEEAQDEADNNELRWVVLNPVKQLYRIKRS